MMDLKPCNGNFSSSLNSKRWSPQAVQQRGSPQKPFKGNGFIHHPHDQESQASHNFRSAKDQTRNQRMPPTESKNSSQDHQNPMRSKERSTSCSRALPSDSNHYDSTPTRPIRSRPSNSSPNKETEKYAAFTNSPPPSSLPMPPSSWSSRAPGSSPTSDSLKLSTSPSNSGNCTSLSSSSDRSSPLQAPSSPVRESPERIDIFQALFSAPMTSAPPIYPGPLVRIAPLEVYSGSHSFPGCLPNGDLQQMTADLKSLLNIS
mmetsp:Transcript_487/g.977  ORF Transcript_487/g.977 Transcript_487/m.977 type:complete len:260 (-) Transcript_487:1758-2537(-)